MNLIRATNEFVTASEAASREGRGERVEEANDARDRLETELGNAVLALEQFPESCEERCQQALSQARSLLRGSRRLKPVDASSEHSSYKD